MWKINYGYLPFVDITEYTAKGGTRWSHTGTTKKIILEKLEQGGATLGPGITYEIILQKIGKGGARHQQNSNYSHRFHRKWLIS
jgi:hypothetical protein